MYQFWRDGDGYWTFSSVSFWGGSVTWVVSPHPEPVLNPAASMDPSLWAVLCVQYSFLKLQPNGTSPRDSWKSSPAPGSSTWKLNRFCTTLKDMMANRVKISSAGTANWKGRHFSRWFFFLHNSINTTKSIFCWYSVTEVLERKGSSEKLCWEQCLHVLHGWDSLLQCVSEFTFFSWEGAASQGEEWEGTGLCTCCLSHYWADVGFGCFTGILQLTGASSLDWMYFKQLIPLWQSGVSEVVTFYIKFWLVQIYKYT